MFPRLDGSPMPPRNERDHLEKYRCTGCGTPTRGHAPDCSAPIHLVQADLGHASGSTTGRYLHARLTESSSLYLPE